MHEKLEKIRSLRRSLEPLAVLFEKAVLEANKEPFEVSMKAHQSADLLDPSHNGEDTVHIIDGESLQAVHEIWREHLRIERQLQDQLDHVVRSANGEEPLPDELTYLGESERAWLEWFYHLSDDDKKLVEDCGEKDVSVTPTNFDQVRDMLEEQDAATWGSVVKLFKP